MLVAPDGTPASRVPVEGCATKTIAMLDLAVELRSRCISRRFIARSARRPAGWKPSRSTPRARGGGNGELHFRHGAHVARPSLLSSPRTRTPSLLPAHFVITSIISPSPAHHFVDPVHPIRHSRILPNPPSQCTPIRYSVRPIRHSHADPIRHSRPPESSHAHAPDPSSHAPDPHPRHQSCHPRFSQSRHPSTQSVIPVHPVVIRCHPSAQSASQPCW